jgi:hypothetical protein
VLKGATVDDGFGPDRLQGVDGGHARILRRKG